MFHKDQSLVLSYYYSTRLLLVLLSLIRLSVITYLLMKLNCSSPSGHLNFLPAQLSEISDPSLLMASNVTITPTKSARNLGIIFDSTLSMSHHISSFSKSCFLSIRHLRRIRNTLDFSTARTIAPLNCWCVEQFAGNA